MKENRRVAGWPGLRVALRVALTVAVLAMTTEGVRGAEIELRPSLVHRLGAPGCWVRLNTLSADGVCFTQSAWEKILAFHPASTRLDARVHWTFRNEHSNPGLDRTFRTVESGIKIDDVRPLRPIRGLGGWIALGWIEIERVREQVSSALRGTDSSGVLRKLLLNEATPGVPGGLLRLLGFVHVLSSAGIHLYAVSAYLEWAGRLWVIRTQASVQIGRFAVAVVTWGVWIFAWLLQGLRPGLLRPLLVLACRRVALAMGLRWRLFSPLIVSIAMDLAVAGFFFIRHGEVFSPGRLHYALAVGAGLMAWDLSERRHPALRHLSLSVGSWFGTALLDAWEVNWVSSFTPIASLLTIPVFTILIFPLSLLGAGATLAFSASPLFLSSIGASTSAALALLASLSVKGCFLWRVTRVGILLGGMLSIGALGLCLRVRVAILVFILLVRAGLGWVDSPGIVAGPARSVTQLDVGQGDAAVIQGSAPGAIDTGPEGALKHDEWLKLLNHLQVFHLNWILLTHFDADHAGGLKRLARLVGIDCVVAPRNEWKSERGGILAEFLQARDIAIRDVGSGCVPFAVKDLSHGDLHGANDAMAAIVVPLEGGIVYGNAGDAHAHEEVRALTWFQSLSKRSGKKLIWKLSHHGSRTSSDRRFLHLLQPDWVWISVGAGNHYGHPSYETLSRLKAERIHFRRTDESGALSSRELKSNEIKGEADRHR